MKDYFDALPKDSIVALETCGFDHWLTDMLQELGLSTKLSHTAKTKAITEERIKTDNPKKCNSIFCPKGRPIKSIRI